jgi:hypothetical protein
MKAYSTNIIVRGQVAQIGGIVTQALGVQPKCLEMIRSDPSNTGGKPSARGPLKGASCSMVVDENNISDSIQEEINSKSKILL